MAAIQAQAILNLVYGDTITQVWEYKQANNTGKWAGAATKPQTEDTVARLQVYEPVTNSFKVYPNPAGDQVTIEYSFADSANQHNFILYDLLGNIILMQPLITNIGRDVLDISNIPNGFYLYNIREENSTLKSGKLSVIK